MRLCDIERLSEGSTGGWQEYHGSIDFAGCIGDIARNRVLVWLIKGISAVGFEKDDGFLNEMMSTD